MSKLNFETVEVPTFIVDGYGNFGMVVLKNENKKSLLVFWFRKEYYEEIKFFEKDELLAYSIV